MCLTLRSTGRTVWLVRLRRTKLVTLRSAGASSTAVTSCALLVRVTHHAYERERECSGMIGFQIASAVEVYIFQKTRIYIKMLYSAALDSVKTTETSVSRIVNISVS